MNEPLDEEYVIQLDDSPPFSWIKAIPERFMSCGPPRKGNITVFTDGPLYSIAKMAEDILGDERITVVKGYKPGSSPGFKVIISHDGESRDAVPFIRNSGEKGMVVSVGGTIKRVAKENGWEYQSLPRGYPMKFLMPEIAGCLLSLGGFSLDYSALSTFVNSLLPSSLSTENVSKRLARQLGNGGILFVYDRRSLGLSKRFVELLKMNSKVEAVAVDKNDASKIAGQGSNVNIISFCKDVKSSSNFSAWDFPYPCDDPYGYLKNAIIAEFSSIYLSLLLGIDTELVDIE